MMSRNFEDLDGDIYILECRIEELENIINKLLEDRDKVVRKFFDLNNRLKELEKFVLGDKNILPSKQI